ncbi:MAG TPA: hypothetical protein VHM25_05130 [Polyangiaceae bacterium]|jgi:hypothetical protein|nr:hypothetical protein [Polyangiaceae bacterium]
MMAPPLTIPTPQGASTLLAGLVGRATPAKKIKLDWTREKGWLSFSEFRHPEGEIAALFVADLPFCSWSGAALALLPSGLAQDGIKAGKLEPALQDNFAEVANVLTATFREYGERVILGHTYYGSATLLPPELRSIVGAPRRLDLEVTITGYGVGRCGLLLA